MSDSDAPNSGQRQVDNKSSSSNHSGSVSPSAGTASSAVKSEEQPPVKTETSHEKSPDNEVSDADEPDSNAPESNNDDANAKEEGEEAAEDEEDEEEEEEEDEEDEEEDSAPKRRKRNQFLDVEAEDDDEEDAEDEEDDGLVGEDGFVQEAAEEGASKVYRQLDRRQEQEKFTDEDAEKIAERYRERYGRSSAKYGAQGAAAVPQQLLLPGVDDPPIFGLNTRIGREKEAVKAVLRKQLSLQHRQKGSSLVYSCFQRDGFPGRIYIECASEQAALHAVSGMPNVFANSKLLKVPIKEYPDMFRVVKKAETELIPGKYVRVKRGKYAGDLAMVLDLSDNGLEARLKLVPRLDYGKTTALTGTEKRKRSERPPQKLFSSQEAAQHDQRLSQHSANAWTYLGDEYVKGFLHKDFKLALIESDMVEPKLSEIAKFQTGEDDELDLASIGEELRKTTSQSTEFSQGERVEVTGGEQTGLYGRVVAVNGTEGIVTVRGDQQFDNLEVSVPANHLRKHFAVGDHVRVIRGNYKDDTGLVVSSANGKATYLSDTTKAEVKVFTRDLKAASDTSVQNMLSGYGIQDLVQLNAQTVGVVVDVFRDSIKVLCQDGQTINVKPESVSNKLRSLTRSATDGQGHEIAVGDTVREMSGEKRIGTVIHIYHQFAFLHNRERQENLGVFVNKVNQLASKKSHNLSAMNPMRQQAPVTTQRSHFNARRIIGQKISIGPGSGYKGLKGVVKDANEQSARVELEAKNKVITVDVQKLLFTLSGRLVNLQEFMHPGRPASSGFGGGKTPSRFGGKTPAWASGAKTPAWASGGKTPAWNAQTPAWNAQTPAWNSNKTPAWNAKTPAWNAQTPSASAKTPAWNAKTPAWSKTPSSKTPAWSAKTPAWSAQTPAYSPSTDFFSKNDANDDDGTVGYDE